MTSIDGKSDVEEAFATQWRRFDHSDTDWQRQYQFAPPRRWRFDFADPISMVAVELQGGVWSKGRHVRGQGYEDDCEKHNAAVTRGWSLFLVTAKMLSADPVGVVSMIADKVIENLDVLGTEEPCQSGHG